MATYFELKTLRDDSDLQDRVSVAIVKKGQALLAGVTPSAAQVTWAIDAINAPEGKMPGMLNYVLGANSSNTVAQIQAASDATLQTNVDAAADAIIVGGGV